MLLTNVSVSLVNAAGISSQCNPVIKINETNVSLRSVLERLAKENHFKLLFPEKINKKISIDVEMPLLQLLKYLSKGISSGFEFSNVKNCNKPVVSALTFFIDGQESEYVATAVNKSVTKDAIQKKRLQKKHFEIKDMESYVIGVFEGRYKSNVRNMTPEQRKQFRKTKQRIRQEYKKQGRMSELRKNRLRMREGSDETVDSYK